MQQPGQPGGPPLPRPQGAPQPGFPQPQHGAPAAQPAYGAPPGAAPYASGPVQPAGPVPGGPAYQPPAAALTGQMQQMGLGPRPPGPMVGVQRPGLAAPAAPAAAVPRLATAPAAAAVGFPVRPAAPASGLVRPPAAGGLAPPGAVWPAGVVRPPGLQPQPRPGAPPHAAGAPSSVPNGYPGHPAAAAPQIRPGAVPLARPPGAHPGGLAAPQHPQYPPAAAPAAAPPPGPGGLLAPRPPGFGAPAAAPAAAPGVGSGVSTPTKASFQQPHPGAAPASPPPYSLQVASPSPVKPGQLGSARGLQPPLAPGGLRPPGLPGPAFAGPGVPHSVGHPGLGGPPPLGMPPQQQPQQPYPAQPGLPGMGAPPGMVAPPGMGAPLQQPPAPAPGAGAKIDPAQIPRPSLARPVTQVFETRRENMHAVPPPADAPIVIKDRGSAGPRYMRSSLNMVPQSAELLRSAALPFVVIVNPLALPEPQDDPIQVVDFGEPGPPRCGECKAYVNPYMRFQEGGRRMVCNFCGAATDVPPDYHCPTGPDGLRRDKYERPELCQGSVEMAAPAPYMARPPMDPVHLFLIDVSQPAVASGATAAVCSSLARLLGEEELPSGDRVKVCVATFDATIHYYSMRPHQARPQMLVVPDVTDVYCPLPGNVVASLAESRALITALLESIPHMFAATQVAESCSGAALKSAVAALKGGVGGRLHAFVSTLPRKGALSLRPRDLGRPPTDRDNLDSMLPENKEYLALAADAAEFQVSVDLFCLARGYVDVATMGVLATGTGGSVYHYAPFSPEADGDEFHNDLCWNLLRPQGLEGLGRLRVSRGLGVDRFLGAFYRRTPTDLDFPALSCDHSLAAKLVHEEKLPEAGEVYLQYALLYSTPGGERRIRVHTLALPITQSLGTTFRGADLDAYLSYVARKVSSQIPGHALGACKEAITKAAIEALLAYRKQCAAASSSGQLILPEALKLLPLYALALTKSPAFRAETPPDARAAWAAHLLSLPAPRLASLLYGRLLPLHGLLGAPAGAPALPDKMWLTAERLEPEGAYLLENGWQAWVYVGKALPPEACAALLGVPSVDALPADGAPLPLPRLDTPLSRAVHALLDEVRRQRCGFLRLRVLRRGDPGEAAFYHALVEDRSPSAGMSYVEFLCFMHRQIQNRLG